VLDVDYEVVDLPAFDIDKLLGSPALRTTMGMLKKMTEGTELEFSDALQPLSEIADVEERMSWLKEMINFAAIVFKTHGLRMEKEAVQKAINPILEGRGNNMVMTIFEEKYYEGKAEGKLEGKAEGKLEGQAETLTEFKNGVINVLRTRFHTVPKRVAIAIREMTDITAIQSLIVDAAVCQSMKEFEKTLK
jgi:hypothetical protein